ncbi:serine threonine kinase [Fusarium subglutinans]|uniref:non-specific serine/threonine protein kinase n=1 Tax=Gibberella subglutinans TaxID=42677 RepID=A0A8H5QC69_GIBSU|nr:serine threonine kinase [Fusarium subglutinans]KAF5611938.1 serine threonine kinase [Fusarium subglutinans]
MDLFQSFSTYTAPPSSSDLDQRPDKTFVVKSQVEFLTLAAHLQVPIISAQTNVFTGINKVHVGEVASFTALSSTEALSFSKDGDILNPTLGAKRWFDENKAKNKFHHYVTKKIKPSQQLGYTDDSQQLSAAINELRVLSNKRIRDCDSIVSLLAISWSEDLSLGRVWPQVLLETADQGNLKQYLSSTEINFQSKMEITVQIADGLEFLYAEQIVHADIKPANILIFSRKVNDFASDDMAVDSKRLLPVTAKICDFGYAVILKDYGSQERFQARLGSNPWMSPELDGGEPIELCYLHKSDVYSFGLLIASIVMNCHVPFAGTAPEKILGLKTRRSEDPDSAVNILMGNLKGQVVLSEHEQDFIRALLMGACDPSPQNRASFAAIRKYCFLGSRHDLDPGGPVTPLSFLRPQLYEPVRGYFACKLELDGDPDSIYEIAGAYLNAQVFDWTTGPPLSTSIQPWTDMGLKHLAAAAMRKSPEAIAILRNAFEACDTPLPEDARDELLAMVQNHVSEVIWESQANLFDHTPAHLLVSDETTSKTWASGLSQWYYEFLSARQIAYDMAPKSHKDEFALYPNGHLVFDFKLLTSYETRTSQRLNQRNKEAFKREVIRLRCAHACDELSSFTLLQIAAVKDDLELAKVLVTELGVPIDSYGNTPAWTPLLLSCHLGHFAMAKWLIENGASPRIKGYMMAQRFFISYIASPKGINVNLFLTSLCRDYSGGLAAQLLLQFGADPTRKVYGGLGAGVLGFATSMGLAARDLRVDLLRKVLAAAESLVLHSVGPYAKRRLVDAKAQAFEALMIRTPLHYMCVGGKGYRESIENIILLLADEQVASRWATFLSTSSQMPMSMYPVDPLLRLSTTCVGSGLFTKPILKAHPQVIVEDPSLTLPWTFLHLAIERQSRESISALIEHGAYVLTEGQFGRNALHVAAQYFPEILPDFIAIVENLAPDERQGKSITEILEDEDERGVTTFDILLIMGYDAERQLAESIRQKYSLQHEHKIHDATIHEPGEWVTFGSYMVEQAAGTGRIMMEHIEYLFSLNPLPDFIADNSGNNLFI